ncbi:MAG: metallophosphoesterase [Verrucomicrobiae bacterium]|nr:metallophosphoesterase [Verrucomicrobiae bacterium]
MTEKIPTGYDIIGDVHGHFGELVSLLRRLGYDNDGRSFRHPARKAVFVGDLIDRGPQIRETLQLVKAMWDQGEALVTLGNHEYNAVCYGTQDKSGNWLRPHSEKNRCQFQATLDAFRDRDEEWDSYLDWFKNLPLFWEGEGFRVVHACWSQRHIDFIGDRRLGDQAFLLASAQEGTREFRAVETILKGPEVTLPEGVTSADKEGVERSKIRARWWQSPASQSFRSLAFPEQEGLPETLVLPEAITEPWDVYPEEAPPVFVGHYWLPPQSPSPFGNVICLDYSVAKEGFLAGYRWSPGNTIGTRDFATSRPLAEHDR